MLGWDIKFYPEGDKRNIVIYWSNMDINAIDFLDLSEANKENILDSSGYPIKVKCAFGEVKPIINGWFSKHSKGKASYETFERAELAKLDNSTPIIVEAWDLS